MNTTDIIHSIKSILRIPLNNIYQVNNNSPNNKIVKY